MARTLEELEKEWMLHDFSRNFSLTCIPAPGQCSSSTAELSAFSSKDFAALHDLNLLPGYLAVRHLRREEEGKRLRSVAPEKTKDRKVSSALQSLSLFLSSTSFELLCCKPPPPLRPHLAMWVGWSGDSRLEAFPRLSPFSALHIFAFASRACTYVRSDLRALL